MFSFIKGHIAALEENFAVIENNGIGYEILISSNTMAKINNQKEVLLYTYLQVKEDGLCLYGFYSMEERKMFTNLITVSGVGCKVALAVLSGMSLNDLALSIANQNTAMLSRIKGIGKKTAERIILELKEKVSSQSVGSDDIGITIQGSAEDAFSALTALGLKRSECLSKVKQAMADGAKTTEQIIGAVLKNM